MFCEQCGTKLIEGERFCSGCGTPIATVQNNVPQANSASVSNDKLCVKCGKKIEKDWAVCPFCKTETSPKPCKSCGKKLNQEWVVCPYCKTEV